MIEYIIALLLIIVAILTISLRRTYNFFPARELKRQARLGDHEAAVLYRAVAYGASLRMLLWIIIGLTIAGAFVLLSLVAPFWIGGLALAGVIWYAFAWAPSRKVRRAGIRIAVGVTPLLAGLLNYIHRPLAWLSRITEKGRITVHTGLFEREDLIELVQRQKELSDNRIDQAELDIVLHALSFGEKTAASVMVPRSEVMAVASGDSLGPILMDELYESGHSRFPVVDADEVVGTLFLRDLVAERQGGVVRDHLQVDVMYVHAGQTLYELLHAFLKTKHPLFVVVDDDEAFIGIITIEDVIEQVIGQKIPDGFDAYDDKRAVVADATIARES